MPKVEIFLLPDRPSLPPHSGELDEGGTVGITNRIGDYEEVIVLHNPSCDEDTYNPEGCIEIYTAPVEAIDGVGRLPAAVHMAAAEIINLVELNEPYTRSITDRRGEGYTLGAHIGQAVLKAA